MKKRTSTLATLAVLTLTMGVQAAGSLIFATKPRIPSDDTTAICTAGYYGDRANDAVQAALTLYQGSTYADSRSSSGTDSVSMCGERRVRRGKSYPLKLIYPVNGASKPSVSATAACP